MDKIIEFLTNPVFDMGFMAQILLPSIIILLSAPKRDKFVLRIIIFTLLAFVSSTIIPFRPFESWGVGEPGYSFITIFGYLLHFAILVVCMYFIFDIKFIECLFCCVMSYNIQHGIYCVSKIFEITFPSYHQMWYLYMGLQYIPNALFAFLIYRYLKKVKGFKIKNTYIFIVSVFALFVNIGLSVFGDCLEIDPKNTYFAYIYYFLGASIVSCATILIMQILNVTEGQLAKKLEMTKIMWKEDRHNYKIQKKVTEEFDIKVHDLKHFVQMFQGKIDQEVLDKMEEILHGREFVNLYETNNLALDVILNIKNQECLTKGIQFNFSGDGKLISFMDDSDIYALFGNIIDNSIDAVKELPKEQRIINLAFFSELGQLIIKNENYFNGNLSIGKHNTLLTTKEHKKGHGYGVASIQFIAKKYKGAATYNTEGNQFFLTVLLKQPIIK